MTIASCEDGTSTLQALDHTRNRSGRMQAQQQMNVGRDNLWRATDSAPGVPPPQEISQESRDATIDKCRPIPCGPAEMDVDAMTHPPKLFRFHPPHVTINTRVNSFLRRAVASATPAEWRLQPPNEAPDVSTTNARAVRPEPSSRFSDTMPSGGFSRRIELDPSRVRG
jgi:hypothetical protein